MTIKQMGIEAAPLRADACALLAVAGCFLFELVRYLSRCCCCCSRRKISKRIAQQASPNTAAVALQSTSRGLWSTFVAVVTAPRRVWRRLFGLNGVFGLYGRHFDLAFRVRELVEIGLQTYQLYNLSRTIPSPWVNHLAVSVVVLNCFGVCLLELSTCISDRRRRVLHVLLDMALDLFSAVGVPLCIVMPYVLSLDVATASVTWTQVLDDVWFASAISAAQLVLITTPLDFVATIVPHLMVLGTLSTLSNIALRSTASFTRAADPSFSPAPTLKTINVAPAPPPSSVERDTRHRQSSKRHRTWAVVTHVWLIGFGVFVLGAHIDAHLRSTADETWCRLPLHAWQFQHRRAITCAVGQLNCHREGISGRTEELADRLSIVDPALLSKLVFSHCAALEIPPIISTFSRLLVLETFNCTLASWTSTAALTDARHPSLTFVFLMDTRMLEFPMTLRRRDLPTTFTGFYLYRGNLTALPSDIGDSWEALSFVRVFLQETEIQELPVSFSQLTIASLYLVNNPMQTLPEMPNSRFLGYTVTGEALRRLPQSIGDLATLRLLRVESTSVSEPTEWLRKLWSKRSSMYLSLYGSTLCNVTPLEVPSWTCAPKLPVFASPEIGFNKLQRPL
ncbi:hypothetical protein PINS_up020721 [Pythium insidiosum]|nr:hypothetical protein PINS_up020721 [Pythium insidiosum]